MHVVLDGKTGMIKMTEEFFFGEQRGGNFSCSACGGKWEIPKFSRYILGKGDCPNCHSGLIEIVEFKKDSLICFGCGSLWNLNKIKKFEKNLERKRKKLL